MNAYLLDRSAATRLPGMSLSRYLNFPGGALLCVKAGSHWAFFGIFIARRSRRRGLELGLRNCAGSQGVNKGDVIFASEQGEHRDAGYGGPSLGIGTGRRKLRFRHQNAPTGRRPPKSLVVPQPITPHLVPSGGDSGPEHGRFLADTQPGRGRSCWSYCSLTCLSTGEQLGDHSPLGGPSLLREGPHEGMGPQERAGWP
ncbi:hypothetical protein GWK47_027706 [Chionoecetes opilio]|uniref:Uncharacterized protein n=1 Tax=Chionoecetes opilio TaxID=41210 RepID=A0A8J8WKQ6_CHIOP|nr:hypothetical protein GWK47_027706 [Chionoecetes opilio]